MTARRRRPLGRVGLICAGLLIFGLVPAALRAASAPLPARLLEPVTGAEVEIAAGAPALHIVFFATWCPVCVEELDRLADLQVRWEQSGYRLVIVAVGARQTPERLARFAAERQPPGRFLHDLGGGAQKAFGAESLPAHFLVDASGAVLADAGALDETFVAAVERHLRGRERAMESAE